MPKQQEKVVLTDRSIRALKKTSKRYTTWDAITPHFGIQVTPRGHKAFKVIRRKAGSRSVTFETLGSYPEPGLAEAREKARETLGILAQGKTRREVEAEKRRDQEQARLAEQERHETTFAGVAEAFIGDHLPRIKTRQRAERLIRQLVQRWGQRPINEIGRKDFIALIKEVKVNSGPAAARRTLGTVSKLMSWALAHDVIDYSPCSQIKITDLVGEFLPRERVLSDAELKLAWHGAAALGYPYGPIFQLLMLLGQRKSEIGNASWNEIDLEKSILRIPGSRMKSRSSHVVPLPPKSMQVLTGLPRFSGPYIFSTTDGFSPVSGYSTAKQTLDRAVAKLGCVAQFTTHDLRRTVRTGLSSLKVPTIVSELVIAHAQQGIHKVYDLYAFEKEKRQALTKWERHVIRIISG